jgi:hypothetical protein
MARESSSPSPGGGDSAWAANAEALEQARAVFVEAQNAAQAAMRAIGRIAAGNKTSSAAELEAFIASARSAAEHANELLAAVRRSSETDE